MTEETVTAPVEADADTAAPVEETPVETNEAISEPEKVEPEKSEGEPPVEESVKEDSKKAKKQAYEERKLRRQNKQMNEEIKGLNQKLDTLMSKLEQTTQPQAPKLEDFNSVEEWAEARDKWKSQPQETQKPSEPQVDEDFIAEFEDNREFLMDLGNEKYDDFESVVTGDVSITDIMSQAIFRAENQAEVAYYLGKNPREAAKISKMDYMRQAIEIGKLDARNWQPAKPNKPKAPEPIAPVDGTTTSTNGFKEGMSQEAFHKQWVKMRGRG